MTIREYLEKNRGFACFKLEFAADEEMLLGLSGGMVDEPFYLIREKDTGLIEWPYVFGLAYAKIQQMIDEEIRDNEQIIENIPEGVATI